MNAFLATLLDPEASELAVTHIEMIKGIAGQVGQLAAPGSWVMQHGMLVSRALQRRHTSCCTETASLARHVCELLP